MYKLPEEKSFDTLFLDRDGTINKRKVGGYIQQWKEFEFLPGVLESLYRLSQLFERIIIVTNQQGIGKELMTHKEIEVVHNKMIEAITKINGRIDQIYYCPHLEVFEPLCRKPNPGMAIQAQKDFPDIDFSRSIMVGDADSDVAFGNNLGMFTVRISKKKEDSSEKADIEVKSLLEFSKILESSSSFKSSFL